jgi:hypothetical protein
VQAAADPNVPGPPHLVSLAEYRKALEPHGMVMVCEARASEASVPPRAANELVVWWAREASVDGPPSL